MSKNTAGICDEKSPSKISLLIKLCLKFVFGCELEKQNTSLLELQYEKWSKMHLELSRKLSKTQKLRVVTPKNLN